MSREFKGPPFINSEGIGDGDDGQGGDDNDLDEEEDDEGGDVSTVVVEHGRRS